MRANILVIFAVIFVIGSVAACRGGVLNVCKGANKSGQCIPVESRSTCINLIGGPFVSGFTNGMYFCRVWTGKGCRGDAISVGRVGGNFDRGTAWSLWCPCV